MNTYEILELMLGKVRTKFDYDYCIQFGAADRYAYITLVLNTD